MKRLMVTGVLVVAAPAVLAQQEVPVAVVDCIVGGICVDTSGSDTMTGSYQYDEIHALGSHHCIGAGNDF